MTGPLTPGGLPLNRADERSRPEWGDGPDGKRVPLGDDALLDGAYADWLAGACQHDRLFVLKWENAGGATCYRRRCGDCGLGVGGQIRHADIAGETVTTEPRERYDRTEDAYRVRRQAEYDAIANAAAARSQPARRFEYSDYLLSDSWRRKRALILKRANHTCEGCLSRPADEVHHLTYAHIYNEFAFELVALCGTCHDRWHQQ